MSQLLLDHISITADTREIVQDVTLQIRSGELHVLMGQNGSGKSTLLNGIMGHPRLALIKGGVLIDDEDVTALSTEKKATKGIFLSMQYLPEIPGVTLLNFLHRAHKAQTGSEVGVLEFYRALEAEAKEVGIDPSFLRRQVGVGLSGGEKKQAEILQMIALRPKFALLDEIDSGVDVDALARVKAGIAYLRARGTGFLMITHYGESLGDMSPDRIHVMKEGKIVRSGGVEILQEIRKDGFSNIS